MLDQVVELAGLGDSRVDAFAAGYDFGLDPFQRHACEALSVGKGVLVCAPTGAGKTVVGEFAAYLALAEGRKCFYTTPIKALSNQKYADLVARHGSAAVGLLTGDSAINSRAQVVVMTTEVLRNMLYAGSPELADLGYVVMDEVHYLADRMRGAVWEEVIIHLPRDVRLVSLSATVSNAEEFADWLVTVRGDTAVVLEEHRPVPLWQHVLTSQRLYDLFVSRAGEADPHGEVNPGLVRLAREDARLERLGGGSRSRGGRRGAPRGPAVRTGERAPGRVDAITSLEAAGLLPAIVFTFSRAGCDASVQQCLRAGLRLVDAEAREQIRELVSERTADLPDADLRVLGYWEWLEGLERGIAAHHAGLLPRFKEVVEELFVRGLVKVVFATETLALGINMPARSVVLTALTKWNGETHAEITPGEFTQLTGRAGRRGIDIEGHAVVMWQPGLDPDQVAGLASTRTYPLRSSFRPSYNMAVNLVSTVGRHRARELLETSFAQFQADKSVVGLARQVRRNHEAQEGYHDSMTCHLGDINEYDGIRRALSARESALAREGANQRRSAARESLEALAVGDVIRVPSGRRSGIAVVLDPGVQLLSASAIARGVIADGPRPLVLGASDRQVVRLSTADFPVPVEPLGRVKIPRTFSARSPQARKDLASAVRIKGFFDSDGDAPRRGGKRSAQEPDAEVARLRAALRAHPVHGCSDRESHLRWAERLEQLEKETAKLEERVRSRTSSIALTFDRICGVLDDMGYLSADGATQAGGALAGIYAESDLLAAECVRRGVWDGLDAPALAACVSALVYEPRRPDEAPAVQPPPAVRPALEAMAGIWEEIHEVEARHRVSSQRELRAGFAWPAHRWAAGSGLEGVLQAVDMPAGDFVRWTRQLIDLLGQIANTAAAGSSVARSARQAIDGLRRGIVSDTNRAA